MPGRCWVTRHLFSILTGILCLITFFDGLNECSYRFTEISKSNQRCLNLIKSSIQLENIRYVSQSAASECLPYCSYATNFTAPKSVIWKIDLVPVKLEVLKLDAALVELVKRIARLDLQTFRTFATFRTSLRVHPSGTLESLSS